MEVAPARKKLMNSLARLDIRQKQYDSEMSAIIDELRNMKKNMRRWQLGLKLTGLAASGYMMARAWQAVLDKKTRILKLIGAVTKTGSSFAKAPLYKNNKKVIDELMTNHPDKRYWAAANNTAKYVASVGCDPAALTNIGLLLSSQKTSIPDSIEDMDQRIEEACDSRLAGNREFIRKRNQIRRLLRAPEYTVVKGDCLWDIAKKMWGEGHLWRYLYTVNLETIGPNPDLIHPGQKLIVYKSNQMT